MSDWPNVRLCDLAEIKTGKLDSNAAVPGGLYPYFTCSPETLAIDNYAFDCDAVLLAGNNANGVFCVKRYNGRFNAYQRTYVITTKNNARLNITYLYYFLNTLSSYLTAFSSGTATKFLTRTILDPTPVPLPPISQQNAIASVLKSLDDKIELNRQMNETLDTILRAFFKDWFVDFDPTRAKMEGREPYLAPELWNLFPEALDDEEIPKGWRRETLAEVAELNPESWGRRTYPDEVEYVDLANTKWGTIEATERHSRDSAPSRAQRILRAGDTIVGTVRPGNGSYAFVGNDGLTGSTGFAVLRPKRAEARELVYCAATSPENIDRLAHLADGGAYPAVRPEAVLETKFVGPSDYRLASSFSKITSPIMGRIEANKRENRTLAATRDLLLPKLMSGEIRLKEAEKVVECAI